jgi:hypothetical protein
MSRAAYRVTLWRTKRWWPHDTEPVAEDQLVYLDLHDETATLDQIGEMIARSGARPGDIGRYSAELADVITGDVVTRIAPGDLTGTQSAPAGQGDGSALASISDQALIWELARRLTRR